MTNPIKAEFRRSANLNIRLTPLELSALRAAAALTYFTPSAWARRAILDTLKAQTFSPPLRTDTKPRR